jgi:CHAT domain-containing protein
MTPPDVPKDDNDDGLLTASEVARLRLDADWVILSACNTAAGDTIGSEALSGMARAFFYAGARSLLVSHWPVYSDAAAQLLDRTFAKLRTEPATTHTEALRLAMIALMDDAHQDDNPHPSIWAPFALVGEGAQH